MIEEGYTVSDFGLQPIIDEVVRRRRRNELGTDGLLVKRSDQHRKIREVLTPELQTDIRHVLDIKRRGFRLNTIAREWEMDRDKKLLPIAKTMLSERPDFWDDYVYEIEQEDRAKGYVWYAPEFLRELEIRAYGGSRLDDIATESGVPVSELCVLIANMLKQETIRNYELSSDVLDEFTWIRPVATVRLKEKVVEKSSSK